MFAPQSKVFGKVHCNANNERVEQIDPWRVIDNFYEEFVPMYTSTLVSSQLDIIRVDNVHVSKMA